MTFINKNNLHKVSIKDKFDGFQTGDVVEVRCGIRYVVSFDKYYIKNIGNHYSDKTWSDGLAVRRNGYIILCKYDKKTLASDVDPKYDIVKVYRTKSHRLPRLDKNELTPDHIDEMINEYDLIFPE